MINNLLVDFILEKEKKIIFLRASGSLNTLEKINRLAVFFHPFSQKRNRFEKSFVTTPQNALL